MTNREVIEQIFDYMENHCSYFGVKITQKNYGNGYFVFELGDDSVCHFKVKGLKRWLFGVWCFWEEEKKKFHIDLFGEHTDYIDKFKPTATEISYSFDYDPEVAANDNIASIENTRIYSFTKEISQLIHSPVVRKFQYYGGSEGLIKFVLDDFWYYRIRKNLKKFKDNRLIWWYLNYAKFIYTLRFKRKNNNFHIELHDEGRNVLPRYRFRVIYDGCDEDLIYDIYHKVVKEPDDKRQFNWLIPGWVRSKTRVIQCENNKDMRGFYYKNNTEDTQNEQDTV